METDSISSNLARVMVGQGSVREIETRPKKNNLSQRNPQLSAAINQVSESRETDGRIDIELDSN